MVEGLESARLKGEIDLLYPKVVKGLIGLPSAQPEITNEEIRFSLKQLRVYLAIKIRDGKDGGVPVELLKRVEEIQKYFENMTSAQPGLAQDLHNACTDAISRQAAIDAMANTLWHYPNECYRNLSKYEFAKGLAELGLKSVPPAQPEQKIGKWVDDGDPLSWVCSECGYRVARYNNTPHCPNCGVKMINVRGEQDE